MQLEARLIWLGRLMANADISNVAGGMLIVIKKPSVPAASGRNRVLPGDRLPGGSNVAGAKTVAVAETAIGRRSERRAM